MGSIEEETLLLRGQQQVWQLMFGFADSMALKCAIQLRIPDIIYSHGAPISFSQIASGIHSPRPDMGYLDRIMRYLVRKNIFSLHQSSDGGDTLFGLTDTSRWLLHDSDLSLNSMVIMQNHPWLLAPWHCFAQCVKEGGTAFKKTHGCEVWDFASQNPEFNNLFNDAMACTNKAIMKAFFLGYKDGLSSRTVQTILDDVGGGTGAVLAEIVKVYPHIKAINFDLPHVVTTAPEYVGISHVGGDMLEAIPNADVVFMKWVLHDWGDEDCVKILRNCRKAIPEKTGKLVLVEVVVDEDENESVGNTGFVFDLLMIAHASGGKERTELEWKKLFKEGGFPRYNIIKIPAITSIIEAYPE